MIVHSTATEWLSTLKSDSVDLVYIDPPFASGQARERAGYRFEDEFTPQELEVLLRPVVSQAVRALKPGGALWVQCDESADWRVRGLLEAEQGLSHVNSVIWWYYNKLSNARTKFAAAHDSLFLFAKTGAPLRFVSQEEARDKPVRMLKRVWMDGKAVNVKGPDGRCEYIERNTCGVSDVWRLPCLQPASQEWTGYPTQKPLALMRRVVACTSSPGDIVVDPMCGSGTTLVAALEMGRSALGADASLAAVNVATLRARAASPPTPCL